MERSRIDEARFAELAERHGVSPGEVRRAVASFFDSIAADARRLPFDDPTRIYSREAFAGHGRVRCIPYVGRVGPVYSRYLAWRANEARTLPMERRRPRRSGLSPAELEELADGLLSGREITRDDVRGTDRYRRVWLVGKDGKRLARQVIRYDDKDR